MTMYSGRIAGIAELIAAAEAVIAGRERVLAKEIDESRRLCGDVLQTVAAGCGLPAEVIARELVADEARSYPVTVDGADLVRLVEAVGPAKEALAELHFVEGFW